MDALPRPTDIYGKTQAGTNALNLPRSALSFSARQLLILIDGRRNLADLASIFDVRSLERSLNELREHGYIEAVRPPAEAAPEPKPLPPPLPLPPTPPAEDVAPPAPLPRNRLGVVIGLLLGVTAAVWVLLLRTVQTPTSHAALPPAEPAPSAPSPASAAPAVSAPAAAPASAPAASASASAASNAVPGAAPAGKPKPAPSYSAADEATEALRRQNAIGPAAGPAAGAPAPAAPPPGAPAGTIAVGGAAPPAAAAPSGGAPGALHVRTQVTPQMPQKAKDLGIDSGKVVVVLHVDPKGAVERVELVSATPPEVYDKAMEQAFAQWTFDPLGIPGRMTIEVEIRPQN